MIHKQLIIPNGTFSREQTQKIIFSLGYKYQNLLNMNFEIYNKDNFELFVTYKTKDNQNVLGFITLVMTEFEQPKYFFEIDDYKI